MWHGRKIRTVGFQYELVRRRGGDGIADVLRVLESHDAGETDERTDGQNLFQPFDRFAKAMKDAAHFAGERLELRKRVVERSALVDDTVQSKFGGDFELLLENFRLPLFVTHIVFRRTAGGTGRTKIIESGLADGDDFGMPSEFAQGRAEVVQRGQRVRGMPADGGVKARIFFGELDRAFAAGKRGSDGNDF